MSALPCSLAIVIPALDAAACLPATLAALQAEANGAAIILVDSASGDATRALAEAGGARVWLAGRGRGRQLAAGVGAARAEFLLLLHADTKLAPGWSEEVALSRRIGRARLVAFETRTITSAIRWRRYGWLRRSARNL